MIKFMMIAVGVSIMVCSAEAGCRKTACSPKPACCPKVTCCRKSACSPKPACGQKSACSRKITCIRIKSCCQRQPCWSVVHSTEDAPWKNVPIDIRNLPDDSLVKRRYIKCFDIIGKSIKSWTRQKYDSRRKFLDGKLWQNERNKLVAALNRNTRLNRDVPVSKEEVLKMAEEMVVYGRGLTVGSCGETGIREVAELYRFDKVDRFLKDAMEYDRYRRKGFPKAYPDNQAEFRDFEKLMNVLNPSAWKEFRTQLAELNETYARRTKNML